MIRRRYVLALDGALLVLALAGRALTGWMLGEGLTPCPYLQWGLLCPACGGTRCIHFLLRGKLLQSFQMNPYIFLTAVLCVTIVALLNVTAFTKKHCGEKITRKILKPRWLVVWAIGFAVFGVLRNVI